MSKRSDPFTRRGLKWWKNESGSWSVYQRPDRNTLWYLVHEPTDWELVTQPYGRRTEAQAATVDTGARHRELAVEAKETLAGRCTTVRDGVTNHDMARAVLTWLADNDPAALDAEPRPAPSIRFPTRNVLLAQGSAT